MNPVLPPATRARLEPMPNPIQTANVDPCWRKTLHSLNFLNIRGVAA
jgi:hypothetical protein